jgi:glycolate oxidase iron-sulfur subunit
MSVTPPEASPRWQEIGRRSLDCVHCGLCLSACPTYRETGRESSSPRGRIHLMRGVAEGRLPLDGLLAEEAFLCLGCRACETACPSGVRYGEMLDATRAAVTQAGLRRGPLRRLERWGLRSLVAHPRRLRLLFDGLAAAQRLGLQRLPLPGRRLRELRALLPPVPARQQRRPLPQRVPAEGARRGRVAFLSGCVMSQLFADVNAATLRVLARNGFEVVVPPEQGCCGALHVHAGDEGFARELVRRNARAFAAESVDAVVVNSAGCGAALREAGRWLPGEGEALAAATRDVCELLDDAGLREPAGRIDARVCYDDPCHLLHGQRVGAAPRRLLTRIPGVELLEHDDPGGCCGAAGTYNLTHAAMSRAVLERKLDALQAVGPDVVASGNPGCLMQLRGGVEARGLEARVVHPITLLDEAYASEGSERPSRRSL